MMQSSSRRGSTSRPVPRAQNSLGVSCITITVDDYHGESSRTFAGPSTTDPHNILSDGLLFVEKPKASPKPLVDPKTPFVSEKSDTVGFPEHGSIPKSYFEYAQRTLSTLVLAGTFMAGVEAQLLSLIFSTVDVPTRTVAIGFAVLALLSTSFVALYCAVTYIWLRQEWKHKDDCFNEWVAGSLTMMMIWCAVFLVVVLRGVGPMSWGFYYWYGMYRGWLGWTPHEDGSFPHRRRAAEV
ncbi:hypothetical protein PHLGIDRAFT_424065 [Phlebiopsis gigantea 11061_1 CR5-6]|uniref:Uncharacterized protein n=1 Tax=Phlebiopsis gigantea (strain 11061_1 CR5-6) TaxID=745531 RepID=A0A0C3PLJ6_PHLG1|nr:hypothetical protein PHLGIDRAFT_424065 [Phlebiopsis gigantea 11061_1 CR5-6]